MKQKTIKKFKRSVEHRLSELAKKMYRAAWLVTHAHEAQFPAELDHPIKVPFHIELLGWDHFSFFTRSKNEPLMREVSATLVKKCNQKENRLIIDIGAWIGDNSLVWAELSRQNNTHVIAIDPSRKNISFIERVQKLNNIQNLQAINALCSSKESEYSIASGDVNHGSFSPEDPTSSHQKIRSTTIDALVRRNAPGMKLFLLHVDVEGMEADVLRGAEESISTHKPYIIFENHLNSEKKAFGEISMFLNDKGYQDIYMINEILPECRPDCRNFIAIHSSMNESADLFKACLAKALKHHSFSQATLPNTALIKVNHATHE